MRVSTSGFAAQAQGANDERQQVLALIRPLFIAFVVGASFSLFLQWPIQYLAFVFFINPTADVYKFASDYFFSIRIWGAPFALMNYVIIGWLVGRSRIRISLSLQVLMNLINILLAIMFVKWFSWDVSGVAAATLIAEIAAFILSLCIIIKNAITII
ncbi:hypothetical protein GCM10020331_085820 [Ectobacillus funiculus]